MNFFLLFHFLFLSLFFSNHPTSQQTNKLELDIFVPQKIVSVLVVCFIKFFSLIFHDQMTKMKQREEDTKMQQFMIDA